MLFVNLGVGVAYGIEPSAGYGVEKVILTSSAADCASPFAPPAGQSVEASCGAGSLVIEPAEDSVYGQIVNASFEFPPTYSWVPATDTFCVVQNCCNTGPVSGC